MYSNIMVPLDASPFSELALPLAIELAKMSDAHVHIVCVHTPRMPGPEAAIAGDFDQMVRGWEEESLRAALARVTKQNVPATAELLDGQVVPALQQYVQANDVGLVVMSTHGRGGIKRAVLGSVAEEFVRKVGKPVLLLRPRSEKDEVPSYAGLARILVPLDGSETSESVLPHAIRMARLTDAELVLARIAVAPFEVAVTIGTEALSGYLERVRQDADAYLENIRETLPLDVPVRWTTAIADRATDGILYCAREQNADMIAMATHGRSGWARIAMGSVAESVLHKATMPVLLIRATAPTSTDQRSMQSEPAHYGD